MPGEISQDLKDMDWNATLSGDFLWSNVNFGEAITEVMTPLTWSVIKFTLEDWKFLGGYPTVGNIGGFPYLNISVFATLFKTIGRSQNQLLDYMEGTLFMRIPETMLIPTIKLGRRQILSSFSNLAKIQMNQRSGIKNLPAYLNSNREWFQRTRELIENTRSKNELAVLWRNEIGARIKRGAWTVLGTAGYASDYTQRLRRELSNLVGDTDASTLISNLSDEEGLLPSLAPLVGLVHMSQGSMPRADYLRKYGHRGPQEFELSIPRPAEDPLWIDRELDNLKASPVDIQETLVRQKAEFDSAWKKLTTNYPQKTNNFRQRIYESGRRTHMREQARSEYVRDRWLVRLFALRAAELAGMGDEVFFLHLTEILECLTETEPPLNFISDRQQRYQQLQNLPPYPPVIRGRFDPFEWSADPKRRSDIFDPSQTPEPLEGDVIRGAPGSAGRVEGLVRKLKKPEDAASFLPGEVLVTVRTDISWTPIFPRAAAVVTDIGAPLSHAAIVARELGIPAVVGCGDATSRLKTGDRVYVDGSAGTVKLLEQA